MKIEKTGPCLSSIDRTKPITPWYHLNSWGTAVPSHALFALQNGLREKGIEYLRKALLLDLRDLMHNTGKEGLHLAGMGESWQAACLL